MFFKVLPAGYAYLSLGKKRVYLITSNWDDMFTYSTQFHLIYADDKGNRYDIGAVKIGQFNMISGQRSPDLMNEFDTLDNRFFSLGQEDTYYDNLNKIEDEEIKMQILSGLNDIVKDETLYERCLSEQVTIISLMRSITQTTIKGQFKRIVEGGARLSRYNFMYEIVSENSPPKNLSLEFNIEPESNPPTNVHVLIGRNGVGKTSLLNNMIRCLLEPEKNEYGTFYSLQDEMWGAPKIRFSKKNLIFSNIVFVTFSAFDESKFFLEVNSSDKILYTYVGLKKIDKENPESNFTTKALSELTTEFVDSLLNCTVGPVNKRWMKAIKILETDPMFQELEIGNVIKNSNGPDELKIKASDLFKNLSSGHKIVLLTITKLVEKVEERTLVLIDEPEAHLHPPLLSAFIRALSELLINRNGVAIVATHSPVILQEVPKSCAWKLRKTGLISNAERLERESFGENVGILTSEVFGLEVTHAGFHKLIIETANATGSYQETVERFYNQLGMEAKAILRAHLASNNTDQS